jgi:hypothetical protein
MNMVIAAIMFVALLAVSVAHFIWALGLTWPIRNQKLLAQTVVGFRDIERMPPRLMSLAVAIATFAAGVVALSLADPEGGGWTLSLIALPLAAVFFARGAIGYTAWWAEKTPEPSFRFNDRRVYSPLCLLLGAGFIALVILRLL